MKKFIAILLVAVMALGLAACGNINEAEVSILWADDGIVKIPNSLINAMERAMYIEHVGYAHYGANGSQETQTKQATDALNKGCAVLLVNLVDKAAAQTIVDLAKAKNVPVVFFDCEVDAAVISGYDKCAYVNTDLASVGKVQGEMIGKYLVEKWDAVDHNADGKITYAYVGQADQTAIDAANAALTAAGKAVLVAANTNDIATIAAGCTEESRGVELIITGSDTDALAMLKALQEKGYNSKRLKTHSIPLFTVGTEADARDFKDTSTMTEEDKAALIYTVTDVIGAGLMAGSAIENHDAVAAAVAAITANAIQGADLMKDVAGANGKQALIPYTTV